MEESKKQSKIGSKEAQSILWNNGILHWKLTPTQKEIYDFIHGNKAKTVVISASRRLGKSYALALIAIEQCLQKENAIVKFIAPQGKMVKTILRPIMRDILKDCPVDLRPDYRANEQLYRFPNGSEIHMAGSDNGNAENIRGGSATMCIIDEAGFCTDLNYIVQYILIPTTTTTRGKIILASTPPKSADHDFVHFIKEAVHKNAFIKKTIYDNPMLTKEQLEEIIEAMNGVDTPAFRREYMAELIQDEEDSVIPEFTDTIEKAVVKEWKMPPYYNSYVSMDIGVRDLTVVLFAYYDFKNAKVIIEDELVMNGKQMLTETLALAIKKKEEAIFCHPILKEPYPVYLRIADNNNLVLLQDLTAKYKINFLPTAKDNKDAAINHLRTLIKAERVLINPRCKTLIQHLKFATWNKARTSYDRSADKGHYDAVDALVYLCRNIQFSKNPYPAHYGISTGDESFFNITNKEENATYKWVKDIFNVKK